jgi:transmembrane sensor
MPAVKSSEAEEVVLREAAAAWMVRRDRGLSAAESIEYELWLAADPRHAAAMRTLGEAWTLLDRTPEQFVERSLAAAARRRRRRRYGFAVGTLAAAAALALAVLGWRRETERFEPAASGLVAAGPRELALADGSVVQLKAGSEVVEEFDAGERRVRLTRGEAHFSVVKEPSRPFVVVAGALHVRAVGTAFNVNLRPAGIEVLVTEGRVQLATAQDSAAPLVEAGQRAVLATDADVPVIAVSRPAPEEIVRALAWQETLVPLGGATLAEVAQEFERRFGARMVLADPELAGLRAGGRLRGDNAQSFAKLLATTFDLKVEHGADGAWVLRKNTSNSR